MADSLITYCYVQPACSAILLHSCKNSHVCGASDHETVIHFASCTTAPPLRPFLRVPPCPMCSERLSEPPETSFSSFRRRLCRPQISFYESC